MSKKHLFIIVLLIFITCHMTLTPIVRAPAERPYVDHNIPSPREHNMQNPKSNPENVDLANPHFYAPFAIIAVILAALVCFLIFRRKA